MHKTRYMDKKLVNEIFNKNIRIYIRIDNKSCKNIADNGKWKYKSIQDEITKNKIKFTL